MKIKDLLKPEAVITGANVESKDQAISMLIDLHDKVGNLSDKAAYTQAVLQREAECVTAIGQGLAIPHAKSDAVRTPGLAAITVPQGIDCKSLDGQPSNLFFMIAGASERRSSSRDPVRTGISADGSEPVRAAPSMYRAGDLSG